MFLLLAGVPHLPSTQRIKQLKVVHTCFPCTWNLHFASMSMMSNHSDIVHASKKASLQAVAWNNKKNLHKNYFLFWLYFFRTDLSHFSGLVN